MKKLKRIFLRIFCFLGYHSLCDTLMIVNHTTVIFYLCCSCNKVRKFDRVELNPYPYYDKKEGVN